MQPDSRRNAEGSIELVTRTAFNPNRNSSWFNAIVTIVDQISLLTIVLTGAALIREREHGTIEHLLVMPITAFEIALAKVWANGLVILIAVTLSLQFVVEGLLSVPIAGSKLLFLFGTTLYLFFATALGMFLGTIARSMAQFALLVLLVILPLELLSGGMTPIESQPGWLQITDVLPAVETFRELLPGNHLPRCRHRHRVARIRGRHGPRSLVLCAQPALVSQVDRGQPLGEPFGCGGQGAVSRGFASLFVLALCALGTSLPAHTAPQTRSADPELAGLIGEPSADLVEPGDTMLDIAYRHRVGFEALSNLNPDVDTWIPVPGTVVRIPSQLIPPEAVPEGLVINIPEMRLFDYTVDPAPLVLAVAVGDPEDPTPTGDFVIRDKRVDPVWNVPSSILKERPELRAQVPPGPSNPLGNRWLRIGRTAYGIHGTNTRWSIGRESTHGCVRLYPAEIERLFDRVPEGTRLQILYQPFKWGQNPDRNDRRIFFEAHPDRYARFPHPLETALETIRRAGLIDHVDLNAVRRTLTEARGVPIAVGTLPVSPP